MESIKEFARGEDGELTPQGWQQYWTEEFQSAGEAVKDWHKDGEDANKRFLDERSLDRTDKSRRLNLFSANIQTIRSMLYGKTPTVDVSRRYSDTADDEARVAAEILQRCLNSDIERDSDSFSTAIEYALSDRLLSGMGNVRVRYEAEFQTVEVPAQTDPMTGEELAPGYSEQRKTREDVATDYVYWKDQRWSPCRVFHEMRWWAFRAEIRRDEARQRFPKDAETLPIKGQTLEDARRDKNKDPWDRIEVWEIWCKEHGGVFWFVEGYDKILERKDDTLKLDGFWPFPRPMVANLTTTAFMPKSDYSLARDLYDEIDALTSRIGLLEDSIRVTGVYDQSNEGLQRILTEGGENKLYPVANFALLAEKGGIPNAVSWFPLDVIVNAIGVLTVKRDEKIQLLYQVTGLSDIMRGAAMAGATATEQAIKARFASVRIQALQDEFARFASDVQKIKSEIISKHFDPQTIAERSNVMRTEDAQLAPKAIELIKSDLGQYRVAVKPENVSLADFTALRNEAMEVLAGIGAFIQSAAPVAQMAGPGGGKVAMEILQVLLTRLKGGDAFEPILDRAIAAAEQAAAAPPRPAPPDPKLVAAQFKAKADMQKTQMDVQAHMAKKTIDVQADAKVQENQARFDIATEQAKAQAQGMRELDRAVPERPA